MYSIILLVFLFEKNCRFTSIYFIRFLSKRSKTTFIVLCEIVLCPPKIALYLVYKLSCCQVFIFNVIEYSSAFQVSDHQPVVHGQLMVLALFFIVKEKAKYYLNLYAALNSK